MGRRERDDWSLILESELQRLSNETTTGTPKLARQNGWSPRVDLFEAPTHIVLKVELAGVKPDRIRLIHSAQRGSLILRGERRDEVVPAEQDWVPIQLEIDFGEFGREIRLPQVALRIEEMRAHYNNGFLIVTIPKETEERQGILYQQTITLREI